MATSNQCQRCARYLGGSECDAYPEGIPTEIFTGMHDHTKPYEGDNGLRFVKLTDARRKAGE